MFMSCVLKLSANVLVVLCALDNVGIFCSVF